MRSVDIRLTRETIGQNHTGAKSRALREKKPVFETLEEANTWIFYPPSIAITPFLWRPFLARAGADSRNKESERAIEKTDFNREEKEALRESVDPFRGLYVAVRSDECTPAGVGLWHTDFMLADRTEESMQKLEQIAKRILASDFSRDVLAFKKRVGLPMDENPGVLVMPVAGFDFSEQVYGTPYHVNVITRFRGEESLLTIGTGIGGANNMLSRSCLSSHLNHKVFDRMSMDSNIAGALLLSEGNLDHATNLKDPSGRSSGTKLIRDLLSKMGEIFEDGFNGLQEILNHLKQHISGSSYHEFSSSMVNWSILQCAPVLFEDVKKPDIPDSAKILNVDRDPYSDPRNFGSSVFGRSIKKSNNVVYIDSIDGLEELGSINDSLSDYILILKLPDGTAFNLMQLKEVTFADHSNVSAVALCEEKNFGLQSHFNGAFREAGIPVLAGDIDQKFLNGLTPNSVTKRKLLVYANDAKEEGFIATVD